MEAVVASVVEYGVAVRARPGESGCGDVPVVASRPSGILVAAIDGLGHGEDAALAASAASSCLKAQAGEPIDVLFANCHRTLRSTRGAVMSVAMFDDSRDSMAWLGIGNVQGVLLRRRSEGWREHTLLLRSGVLGSGVLPEAPAEVLRVTPGDTLILATDGIDANFGRDLALNHSPQRAAEFILDRWGKDDDDALVLVARYLGAGTRRPKAPVRLRRQRSRR